MAPADVPQPLRATGSWFYHLLIAPSPKITDKDLRRRATLHAALVLVVLIGGALAVVVQFAEEGGFHLTALNALSVFAVLLLFVAYALSRTRHYYPSAALTVLMVSTLVWRLWSEEAPTDPNSMVLSFVAVPIILSALLLPMWGTLLFVAATLVTIASMPTFAAMMGASLRPGAASNLAIFVVLVSGLVLVGSYLLDKARQQIALQAAQLTEANERLRNVDQSRIQFLNQAAHDLASPLTPIKIQLALLQEMAKQTSDKQVEKSVAMMDRNIRLFEKLVEDVRELAKLEGGHLKLELRPTPVKDIVAPVVEFYSPLAKETNVSLDAHVPTDLVVAADARRVQQVLNNLVSNAIKFTPPNGKVAVSATKDGPSVVVRVKDSGRGLSADEIPRLFKPFSQVHAPGESRERGTGLGLYICKGFVEAHGGKVWVESDGKGFGSTFVCALPAAVR